MRPLTPFVSYLDNAGHPLVGRIRFCNPDASPAEVFAEDGTTSLGSSVFTDSSGRPVQQPFLEDHDYLLFFDKYVGHATMTEDNDTDSWEEQGSAKDRYNTIGISLDGNALRTFGSVAELRSAELLEDGEIVVLLGYNVAGDKPAIMYKWDERDSASQENYGSVIVSDNSETGRWLLTECPRQLDVRHFGAFPLYNCGNYSGQRYAVQRAADYAHANGRGLFFPATPEAVYYDVSGLTLYDVDMDDSTRLSNYLVSNQTEIVGVRNLHCVSKNGVVGTIHIVDKEVRTSWGQNSEHVWFDPTERLIIDAPMITDVNLRSWSGIRVDILVYSSGMTFDNCEIYADGTITGAVTIMNSMLDSSWFAPVYSWTNLTSVGNTILLDNCDNASVYIRLKNKQEESDYGDLGEQSIENVVLLPGAVAENAVFHQVGLRGDTELHNVSGDVYVSVEGLNLNLVDCWIEFRNTEVDLGGISLKRGSIKCTVQSGLSVTGELLIENADVYAKITSTAAATYRNCNINGRQTNVYARYLNCDINELVELLGDSNGSLMFDIIGCKVAAIVTFRGTVANTQVTANICNNVGVVNMPIQFSRDNLAEADSSHNYTYEGNIGTFLPSGKLKLYADILVCFHVWPGMPTQPIPSANDIKDKVWIYDYGDGETLEDLIYARSVAWMSGFTGPINLFRIGVDPFVVRCDWSLAVDSNSDLSYMTPTNVPFVMNFGRGFEWSMSCPGGVSHIAGIKYLKTGSNNYEESKKILFELTW